MNQKLRSIFHDSVSDLRHSKALFSFKTQHRISTYLFSERMKFDFEISFKPNDKTRQACQPHNMKNEIDNPWVKIA